MNSGFQEDGGVSWIKYAHKMLSGDKYRRYYYHCSEKRTSGCSARMLVDRNMSLQRGDTSQDIVCYSGAHNHPTTAAGTNMGIHVQPAQQHSGMQPFCATHATVPIYSGRPQGSSSNDLPLPLFQSIQPPELQTRSFKDLGSGPPEIGYSHPPQRQSNSLQELRSPHLPLHPHPPKQHSNSFQGLHLSPSPHPLQQHSSSFHEMRLRMASEPPLQHVKSLSDLQSLPTWNSAGVLEDSSSNPPVEVGGCSGGPPLQQMNSPNALCMYPSPEPPPQLMNSPNALCMYPSPEPPLQQMKSVNDLSANPSAQTPGQQSDRLNVVHWDGNAQLQPPQSKQELAPMEALQCLQNVINVQKPPQSLDTQQHGTAQQGAMHNLNMSRYLEATAQQPTRAAVTVANRQLSVGNDQQFVGLNPGHQSHGLADFQYDYRGVSHTHHDDKDHSGPLHHHHGHAGLQQQGLPSQARMQITMDNISSMNNEQMDRASFHHYQQQAPALQSEVQHGGTHTGYQQPAPMQSRPGFALVTNQHGMQVMDTNSMQLHPTVHSSSVNHGQGQNF